MFQPHEITIPYTEDQLVEARKIFETAPSFDGTSISTTDIANYCANELKIIRTPEQWGLYVKYFNKKHGGRLSLDDLMDLVRWNHNTEKYFEKVASLCDNNKNGFIDKEDIEDILEVMKMHSGKTIEVKTYSEFLKAADRNKDGKVSIEECAKWIGSQLG